ncbi:MAG TPA: 3-keto-5-aminohexanoate cleavage protein [Actinomycetota bacterium]|nr:3-keto-5-aminohexanoate cleavage protein [Actinomycetota bacterium]
MLLQAALNGSRQRGEHLALPVSPPELALDAYQAVVAGAGAVHVHPRQADGTETLEPGSCALAVAAIRRVVPGTPVGLTTGAWIEPDPDRRRWLVERWEKVPDYASVNVAEDGWEAVAEAVLARGIAVEAGLTSVLDAESLAASALGERCLRTLVEVAQPDPTEAAAAAADIDATLDAAGLTPPRLHHGEGPATWAVLEAAAARGRDIRVGLEDTLVLPDGRTARDNAELVRAAVRLAEAAP